MKKIFVCVLFSVFVLSAISMVSAGSILPQLSETQNEEDAVLEQVVMPSLQQVSWYDPDKITKDEEGKIVYTFYGVSEEAYQELGTALGESGYSLKDNTTDEEGHMHFVVSDDTNEFEIIYYEAGGDMKILYPDYAVPAERDEESLTVHLQIGEPFRTQDELIYSLVTIKPVSKFRNIYKAGYPVVFRYDETRESSETVQYVIIGYTCQNTAIYEVDTPNRYFGEVICETEDVDFRNSCKGNSNISFTEVDELADSKPLSGESTKYYAAAYYFDPTNINEPVLLTVSFMSPDKLIKYVYNDTIDLTEEE